ncbi:MAG: UDP-N-acetylglucosamine 1-carboxyvinyltransferase [candidate division Zixibacteria bacterium]|nr:UDP-N-acetylglucosamine 1-carboxyvinyltransferase [candidate division Zixibacteria bacterium]
MDKFIIRGAKKLSGKVTVQGAKNAALPIIAASLLIKSGESVIRNVPPLRDIFTLNQMLEHLGAKVSYDEKKHTLRVDASGLNENTAPYELMSKMRASFLVLGPILQRMGEARVSLPGGCALGPRPVDYHIKGFARLGAEISEEKGFVVARAKRLKGNIIYFDRPSHTGTENLLYGAVMAKGSTRIINAACDPEVIDLVKFLKKAGAKISGAGTPEITIEGVSQLEPVKHTVMGDRLEAGTFLMAAMVTQGDVFVSGVETSHLELVLQKLTEAGAVIKNKADGIHLTAPKRISPLDVVTYPFPGYPTDLQACLTAMLTKADGTSRVRETIFQDAFSYVMELRRLGADISVTANEATINGVKKLTGTSVMAPHIRAGAGLVIAGLASAGRTDVLRVYHIDRGYNHLEEKLQALGADIKRVRA